MIELLKIVHLLSLALGVGGGFAILILALRTRSGAPDLKTGLGPQLAFIARLGFFAILLLWISGFGLIHPLHDGFANLSALFWVKIAFVVALTILSGGMQLIAIGVLPASLIADPARKLMVFKTASALATIIVILAVFAFG